ncbi:HD domain-containing protein [Deltaproteobacteria bacterium TL4]
MSNEMDLPVPAESRTLASKHSDSSTSIFSAADVAQIERLEQQIRVYLATNSTTEELQLLEQAFEDISRYHGAQVRQSGQPVVIHPLRVAWSACQAELDAPTVIASLLHDSIEDTSINKEFIQTHYGDWYAEVVDGLTKIKYPEDSQGKQSANLEATYQKMLVAMIKDVRSLLIKLFDRLDNMRDMAAMPRYKQRRISRETLVVYVPMARRLGLEQICHELTELSFQYLYPKRYERTVHDLNRLRDERWSAVLNMCELLQTLLSSYKILQVDVIPILATPASYIFKKDSADKVLNGIRILVQSSILTYHVLGVLHTNFSAVPLKIRDYISNPRWNGYQALQTEIFLEGEHVFLEILSLEMHELNLHGIMAHWKGTPNELAVYYQSYLDQLDQIAEGEDLRMDEVLRYTQLEQIQVFTPKGDPYVFPKGATVLDFAYHIHTDLGNKCVGALVNYFSSAQDVKENKRVPRDRKLFNGEFVQILTEKAVQPHRSWLQLVITAKAKLQIKRALNYQRSQRARKLGRDLFHRELELHGENTEKMLDSVLFLEALEQENLSKDKFFQDLGLHKRNLRAFLKQHNLLDAGKLSRRTSLERLFMLKQPDFMIQDLEDIIIHFAECCSPIPGDKIIGFVNENMEIEVHRTQCADQKIKDFTPIHVTWNLPTDDIRSYELHLLIKDAPGVLYKVTKVIKELAVGIEDSKTYRDKADQKAYHEKEEAHILIKLEPIPWKTYHKIVEKIRALKVVKRVWS